MYRIRSLVKNRRGQAMVEMALALPVLILLLLATMEFGRVLHGLLVVTQAAREGARSMAVNEGSATAISRIQAAAPSLDPAQMTITINPLTPARGQPVTVTVVHPVQIITPLISEIFPENPFPVTGTAVMRVE
ncbi:MAG: TadE/TadG family type IV pilus assembly protein [Bacillota bacterium]|nr:TadE/TadG family type IV pilus assembly protein [Negativicutes bacterium]